MRSNENRFSNYREMTSRFDSVGKCGHAIRKGQTIGWHKYHGAQCSECWRQWVGENAAAAFDERQMESLADIERY